MAMDCFDCKITICLRGVSKMREKGSILESRMSIINEGVAPTGTGEAAKARLDKINLSKYVTDMDKAKSAQRYADAYYEWRSAYYNAHFNGYLDALGRSWGVTDSEKANDYADKMVKSHPYTVKMNNFN